MINTDDLFIAVPEIYYATNQYNDVFETGKMSQCGDLHEFDEPNWWRHKTGSEHLSKLQLVFPVCISQRWQRWSGDRVTCAHLLPTWTHLNITATHLRPFRPWSFILWWLSPLSPAATVIRMDIIHFKDTAPQKQQHINSSHISMQNPSLIPEIPDRTHS